MTEVVFAAGIKRQSFYGCFYTFSLCKTGSQLESIVAVVNPAAVLSRGAIHFCLIFKTLQWFILLVLKITMHCICMCSVLCNLIGR